MFGLPKLAMAALLLTRRSTTATCRLLRPAISSSSSSPIPPPVTNTTLPPQHYDDKAGFSSLPNPTTTKYHHLPTPTKLRFFPTAFKPSPTIDPFLPSTRFLSSSSSPQDGQGAEKAAPEMKHQEIEGPTVERDLSALAHETRQVLENLQRVLYDLSKYMAILALAHLASGAWIAYHAAAAPSSASPLTDASSIQGFAAFAFPFAAAFLLRRSVPPMRFFQKMEEQGRLQILTLALQISKCLNLLLLRLRLVSVSCVVGLSLGMMCAVWAKTRTTTTTTTAA